jgi:TrwC relaxase
VMTISRLSRWSINYYNDTAQKARHAAMDRQRANGGLGEYYSERDTRTPTWLIAGDPVRTCELVELGGRAADGGPADPQVVQRWLDDGIAPNAESGRAFAKTSVHGFDLTFAAPKSVSLLRALRLRSVARRNPAARSLRAPLWGVIGSGTNGTPGTGQTGEGGGLLLLDAPGNNGLT